jgi:hypothetical protein
MMIRTRLWGAAGIIALIVIGGFVLSVPHTRDIVETKVAVQATSTPVVVLRDAYKKGVHSLSGSLLAPNACATVSAEASLQGDASSSQSILLNITMSDDTGVCLQLPTKVSFDTTIQAPAGIPITSLINGAPATSTPL